MFTDNGSFRDPSGQVFEWDGKIFRTIYSDGAEAYEAAKTEGIYDFLMTHHYLIDHQEISPENPPDGAIYVLEHPRLPIVTYPWEWPFSMLKDAARLHLEMMDQLVPKGFWLRDASAFNVQYSDHGLVFIDTLSIGPKIADSPWVAYRQFCSHFLAPLAMAAHGDIGLLGLWRNYIDGFPLSLAVNVIGKRHQIRPGLFMHLYLHSKLQQSADNKQTLHQSSGNGKKISDRALLGIIFSLRKCIEKLQWKPKSAIWKDYDTIRTYEQTDVQQKADFVSMCLDKAQPKMVWDLGGNTGEFSMIAADKGAHVLSVDGDPACTELIYTKIRKGKGYHTIYPITMDLTNPSPGLGWDNTERKSLRERGPADMVFALALIHHLLFSGNIPMDRIVRWLHSISRHLIVEFIPETDPMILKLTQNRQQHLAYSMDIFLKAFLTYFDMIHQTELGNGRILFYGKGKSL